MATKKQIKDMSDKLVSYFDFVVSNIAKTDDLEEKMKYIEDHKIKTRIIEKDGESYFSIFKGKKLIDQNNTRLFI